MRRTINIWLSLLCYLTLAMVSSSSQSNNGEVLHTRKTYYVGGEYVDTANTSGAQSSGQLYVEQLYVEELKPAEVKHQYPILFWPGNFQTGACWLTTPDGRPGWANLFLEQGYKVYLVDIPERGRSPWLPNSSNLSVVSDTYVSTFWTATQNSTNLWSQANLHTQWPGSGIRGDKIFDALMRSQVQSRSDYGAAENSSRQAASILIDQIGPVILMAHSQGGGHAWAIGDSRPNLIKGLIGIEPLGPPFVNRVTSAVSGPTDPNTKPKVVRPYGLTVNPIAYDPPVSNASQLTTVTLPPAAPNTSEIILQTEPARKLSNLSRIPILVVTSESGYHANYDYATVAYLRQGGVKVDWMHLPELGIHGNGHFMFMEKNSLDIAHRVQDWMESIE